MIKTITNRDNVTHTTPHFGDLVGNLRERDHLEGPGIDGRTISTFFFKAEDGRIWTRFMWPRTATNGRIL
jgi:hypothetical protein